MKLDDYSNKDAYSTKEKEISKKLKSRITELTKEELENLK